MIKNYLKIASSNLGRRMIFSSINIKGLAVGMAACFLIFLCVRFEGNYDSPHSSDRILIATGILATLTALYTISFSFWIVKATMSNAGKSLRTEKNKGYKLMADS